MNDNVYWGFSVVVLFKKPCVHGPVSPRSLSIIKFILGYYFIIKLNYLRLFDYTKIIANKTPEWFVWKRTKK